MKRAGWRGWMVVLAFGCSAWSAQAQNAFDSALGLRGVVPPGWTALTQAQVQNTAAAFETNLSGLKQSSPELMQQIMQEVRAGRIDFLFAPPGADPRFRDNINVRTTPMGIPDDDAALQAECQGLPAQLQQVFGRPMKVQACRKDTLPLGAGLFLEFDGANPGLRSLQYNVPLGAGIVWQMTGTFTEASLAQQRPVFMAFARSLKKKQQQKGR